MPSQSPAPHELLIALLNVQNIIERRSDSFFAPYGLSPAQFNILNLLIQSQGRLNQVELVDQLLVGKSTISVILNRMFKSGFIDREDHPTDRRQTILVLTEKGREVWTTVSPIYQRSVNDVFGSIPEQHRAQFLNDLAILQKALISSS